MPRVRVRFVQAPGDEVGLISQNADCVNSLRRASLSRVEPLITLETVPAETPAQLRGLFAQLDQLYRGLKSENAGPENETEEFDSEMLNS